MNKYNYILLAGFLLWFIGTWHGGWQMEAQSNFERFTDTISTILIVWGIFGDILSGIQIHKVTNISTPKTTIENHNKCIDPGIIHKDSIK